MILLHNWFLFSAVRTVTHVVHFSGKLTHSTWQAAGLNNAIITNGPLKQERLILNKVF